MHVSPTRSTTIDNAATTAQPPVPRATSQPIAPRDSIARTDASDRHLPHGFPLARIIELAAAAHGIDPKLPTAVGEQESGMGRGAGYDRTTHVGADGHGHGILQMTIDSIRCAMPFAPVAIPRSPPVKPHVNSPRT